MINCGRALAGTGAVTLAILLRKPGVQLPRV